MNLIAKINAISAESKNKFKPDLAKYGKNFRAISDSALLEVLNPLFKQYNISYAVYIRDKNLHIEKIKGGLDPNGYLVETLVFVAEAKVALEIRSASSDTVEYDESITFEGWGMGVDAGDKATGKAITAAVKYALFKGFRLQYSDDPDAIVSEDIKEISLPEKKEAAVSKAKEKKKAADPEATESQMNYIKGLIVACSMTEKEFEEKYGCKSTGPMLMKKARAIIDDLKAIQDASLPF